MQMGNFHWKILKFIFRWLTFFPLFWRLIMVDWKDYVVFKVRKLLYHPCMLTFGTNCTFTMSISDLSKWISDIRWISDFSSWISDICHKLNFEKIFNSTGDLQFIWIISEIHLGRSEIDLELSEPSELNGGCVSSTKISDNAPEVWSYHRYSFTHHRYL